MPCGQEFGDTISPPATQVHHLATPERHPLQQASSNINDIHPSQQYVASTGIQQPTATTCQVRIQHHGHPQISLLKQQEWQSSPGRVIEWQNFSPQARGPLLHRHVTASQDYHLRGDGYQLSGRENNRNQVSKNSRYYVENRVSSAQFAASKAKSTGSFMFDGRVSGSEFRSRTEELNSASDDRSAYRLQPERSESHDVNAIRALRDLSMRYHESSGHRHQRTVSEPSSPMAASSHLRPQIYHPSRSFSFSGIQEERKPTSRHESEPHAPRTPTQPVVHRVSRMVTLKDRIDQQIKEFEISFQDAPSGMNEDEQQLSGQASTDPDCVRDQVLLIGEEELVRREVLNPWERHGIHEEKPLKDVVVSPSERATSPSSQSVFIPMLQADALDGWGANYSSPIREPVSTATSSTDRSSFSASSEHHNTTIQFREGSEWVGFGEEIGEGKGYDDESSPQFCIPSPGRHSNATTHIPSQHSNATSSSGQSLFASLSQGVNVRESSDWTAFNDEENTDGEYRFPHFDLSES